MVVLPRALIPMLVLVGACGDAGSGEGGAGGDGGAVPSAVEVDAAEIADAGGEGSLTVAVTAPGTITVHLASDLVLEAAAVGASAASLNGPSALVEPDGEPYPGGIWLRPRPVTDAVVELVLEGSGVIEVELFVRGAPVPEARRERSLFWTDPSIVDAPQVVGLARVLGAASDDGHGGVLLDNWLRRFATTQHSERAGPAQLADEIAADQGADPSAWDLDVLPFKVTGVHNRIDLAARGGGCGELRVSLASTHPIYAPLHVLFLFRQAPQDDDVGPDGAAHCLGTARRWARLSSLDGQAFTDAARALLDVTLVRERFLLAETVELTVSPWEWRQWSPAGADELDNPALFQTVDAPRLNVPGALRDELFAFVEENAEGLSRREIAIPSKFRSASARLPPSAPAERLSLEGLDPAVLADYPDLAEAIEIVGCPTCHTTNASFVQTTVEREPSPFYDLELDARADRLDRLNAGSIEPVPPFGPLQ
ncbi:MAG: hypothetical protein IPM79_13170 [Polyangiaceae bacterium]|jgi:hypothetical protein|nr:hypothetical protein [Polyangiaceae bacterium]MBK8938551.1 hypothetical protein [Polyangiaceae bacterium]